MFVENKNKKYNRLQKYIAFYRCKRILKKIYAGLY